jgi:hypothetical protein
MWDMGPLMRGPLMRFIIKEVHVSNDSVQHTCLHPCRVHERSGLHIRPSELDINLLTIATDTPNSAAMAVIV